MSAIIYTNKGIGLQKAIAAAGYSLWYSANQEKWLSSDDAAVQEIIDTYDPLPYERAAAKARIRSQIQAAAEHIESAYCSIEKQVWPYLRLEIEAWQANSNAPTPTINAISTRANEARSQTLASVAEKVAQFRDFANKLVGDRKKIYAEIDAETDWLTISQINYTYSE